MCNYFVSIRDCELSSYEDYLKIDTNKLPSTLVFLCSFPSFTKTHMMIGEEKIDIICDKIGVYNFQTPIKVSELGNKSIIIPMSSDDVWDNVFFVGKKE